MDFEVVGESFYESSFHNLVGPQRKEGYRQKCTAVVSLEDDNPRDRNAVKVSICGYDVGHFSRTDAAKFRKFLDRKSITERCFLVDAVIVGGRIECHYGVFLDIKVNGPRQTDFNFVHSGDYDSFKGVLLQQEVRMTETERPLNYCCECPNTWYPRGKDLSNRCPKCKSERVTNESILEVERAKRRAIKEAEQAKIDTERRRVELIQWQAKRKREQEEIAEFWRKFFRLDGNYVGEFCFKLTFITIVSILALVLGIKLFL